MAFSGKGYEMTNQVKGKRGNFISKNKLHAVSEMTIFVVAVVKLVFLFKQTGNLGVGVYATVFAAVMLIGFLIAGVLLEVTRKAVIYRRARGQYKNAVNMMKAGSLVGFVIGCFIFLILFFVSGRLTDSTFAMGAYGRFTMLFMAASLPFLFMEYAIIGCFEGFSIDTAKGAAKLIFAVTDLLISLVFIFTACKVAQAHAALLHDENIICAFGATGAAAGFLFSCVVALVWLRILFRRVRIKLRSTIAEDGGRGLENVIEQIRGLFSACPLPLLRNVVLIAPLYIELLLLFRFQRTLDTVFLFGGLISGHLLWFMLPILLNSILCSYSHDYVEKVIKKEDIYHGGMRIVSSLKQYLCTILPMVCVLLVIYPLLYEAFFNSILYEPFWMAASKAVTPYGGNTVLTGCFVALLCLSMLIFNLLRGVDREMAGILCGLAACAAQTVCAVILLKGEVNLNNLFVCGLVYALVLFASALVCLFPFCVYRKNLIASLVMPVIASVAALVGALFCKLLKNVTGGLIAACLAIVISFLIHSVTLVVMGCTRKGEAKEFPQGAFLSLIGRIIGIDS